MRASLVAIVLFGTPADAAEDSLVDWQSWSPAVFEQAQQSGKLILLNLEAVWCHWCHVMDQKTYADPAVAAVIDEHFVAVKVDHDARPDLANRYRDYGWPATIVIAANGTDLVKRAGYIEAQRFARLLRAVVDDPTPERAPRRIEPSEIAVSHLLSDELRELLEQRHQTTFDWKLGGYKTNKKTMDRDSTEYALVRAMAGDSKAEQMARKTIDASMKLIDPEWGGAYQYSTYGDWKNPHYEKVMAVQAGFLRIYALAYGYWKEPRYLDAAMAMERYLADFLTSPEGAYYTSQDADLVQGVKGHDFFAKSSADRLRFGLPRIDTNRYARENGWAIEAVATLYQATGDRRYLDKAVRAAEWIIAQRALPGGGYRHDEIDAGGPYLADTLNMGRAFLQLYRATAERRWLSLAADAGSFIDANFRGEAAGFLSGAAAVGPIAPVANIDENVSVTRFFNLLAHYTGDESYRDAAEFGMRYLATPKVATQRIEEGGILLAARELANDPPHFTVVGAKDEKAALALYDVARDQPGWYKRIEWWDTAEGPLPNPDVRYPVLSRSAAFVCTQGRCSIPAFATGQYRELIAKISARSN